ncbi:4Fe-4S single cluster domain-containing protein [Arthrobacter sp. zg-Y820]|uniref:4Fe-4S single cluster domain-containing protein n=1 Tax=unclassified Arthrobacter TaxID=235627 RepID=UPI0025403B0C|nr:MULTISPECIES: 4Fe-4S single cluster domain-containing protein [unclassified Arthrobacter]WIB11049.1 4Fe-4S single cluster domain-containing protein [Arthrobacter sp. zg-Y820]
MRIASVIPRTTAEGPGTRFAIWAQGCSIRCSGCFNPHYWNPEGGRETAVEELAQQAIYSEAEGITLLGGEPFEQAPAFASLAETVRSQGLSVMVFTGYEREHLESRLGPEGAAALLAATDLLVDGPYQADQPDLVRPWVGSANQRFHFLTDRYSDLEQSLTALPDRLELRIGPTGSIAVNGWAPVDRLDALLEDLTRPIGRGQIR